MENGVAGHDRETGVGLPKVAELLDRELNRAPALRVDAFAEERNRPRVVDPVAYSGK